MGHKSSGIVAALGSGVTGFEVGDRIAIQNILGCGRCEACHRGMPNVCDYRRTIGVHRDGGYAELCAVPGANCVRIADDVSFHLGAALSPFAVCTNAVTLADLEPGHRILVWGLGPIGLGIVAAARVRGAEVALGIDINPVRLAEAEAFGVPTLDTSERDPAAAVAGALEPRSLDAVFEAAGLAEAIEASLPLLRKTRPILLVGNLKDRVDADLMPVMMDQQKILGSRSYSLAVYDLAVRTIAGSGYERTLGETVLLDEAIDRFEAAASGAGRAFSILPNGPTEGLAP
jgi:(R,R)-butanediol dehydrogenase/meso-butanediol dehydrogenase/diacetyl reductase